MRWMLRVELCGDELELLLAALAHDPGAHRPSDQLADDDALQLVHALDRRAVELHDQILRAHARTLGGPAFDDLHDLDAAGTSELPGKAGRKRPRPARDAEVGAAKAAFGHQRAD